MITDRRAIDSSIAHLDGALLIGTTSVTTVTSVMRACQVAGDDGEFEAEDATALEQIY